MGSSERLLRLSQNLNQQFQLLEATARDINAGIAVELPEVAGNDEFFLLEAALVMPEYDEGAGGYILTPPEEWTIGSTDSGEEVRVEFLEPEGGAVIIHGPETMDLSLEASVLWIVRFSRRNVLLTDAGMATSIHVVPVAAHLIASNDDGGFWISSEAIGQQASMR